MIDYSVAKDIEMIKELSDYSYKELASQIGISEDTLSYWMNSRVSPSMDKLEALYELAFKKGINLNRIKQQFYSEEMNNSDSIVLSHGCKNEIDFPLDINHSKETNDFGKGFYCGENIKQSISFVSSYDNSSLYLFSGNLTNLKIERFYVENSWLLAVAYYRKMFDTSVDYAVLRPILKRVNHADVIIAPIADNRMFKIISAFFKGEITDIECQHCLSATELGYQYIFRTQKAIDQLQFLEHCYLCESEKQYYAVNRLEELRANQNKVKLASRQYRCQGIYIEDLLK